MTQCYSLLANLQIPCSSKQRFFIADFAGNSFLQRSCKPVSFSHRLLKLQPCKISRPTRATTAPMEVERSEGSIGSSSPMKLLFVEMGVGYDQHGCCFHRLFLSFTLPFDSFTLSFC